MQIPGKLDLYNVGVLLHITSAIIAFGIVLVWPLLLRGALNTAGTASAQGIYELGARLHQRVVTPAMVVVLLAGLYLASARWKLSMTWINMSLTLLIVLFGLVGAVTIPTLRRLGEAQDRADTKLGARVQIAASASALLVVVVLILMVLKPGA